MKIKISRKWEDRFHWWFGPNSLWAKIGLPPYRRPERVVVTVCSDTERLARDTCVSIGPKEFLKGEEPTTLCDLHEKIAVEICEDSEKLPNPWCKTIVRKSYYSWELPTAVCNVHKEPEYVVVEVCSDTGLLKNNWCPRPIEKRFLKGEEPTAVCDVHKPKPKPERTFMPAQVEMYHVPGHYAISEKSGYEVDGVKIDRDTFWARTFQKFHSIGIERIGVFPYVVEDGGISNHIAPWTNRGSRDGGPWDLDELNPVWWEATEKIKVLAAENGVLLVDVLFPGAYGERPFRNNTNGVRGEWSEEAKRYQKDYMQRLVNLSHEAYKDTRWKGEIWYRLSNEVAHGGDWDFGKIIARRHRFWYEANQHLVPLDRVINDGSHSDLVYLDLVERSDFPKGSGDWFGDDSFKRRLWPELHSVSPKRLEEPVEHAPVVYFVAMFAASDDAFEREAGAELDAWAKATGNEETMVRWDLLQTFPEKARQAMVPHSLWNLVNGGCGWRHWVLSTDGCDSGSGWHIPKTSFRGLTRDELGGLCRTSWTSVLGPHAIIVADLPFEIFVPRPGDGFLIEDFTRIPFDRLSVMDEVWRIVRPKS